MTAGDAAKSHSYRLEWRTPIDAAVEPQFALWRWYDNASSLVSAAVCLQKKGSVLNGEFYVAATNSVGKVEARALTTTVEILAWNPEQTLLPRPVDGTVWAADLARAEAATGLLEGIRAAVAGAAATGALSEREGLSLMAAVREALDQDECF